MTRRWNGWGDAAVDVALPAAAAELLASKLGPAVAQTPASFEDVVASVPASRLALHPLVDSDPAARARLARGQGFPDVVALRSGRVPAFPDGVAFPESREDVRVLLRWAADHGAKVIPHGGGTSVVGGVTVEAGEAPVLVVSMARRSGLLGLDLDDRLATFGTGVAGPHLEAHLRARGFTLGHFPQSFELSTLGGWIATRSRGQQSLGYGAISDLFAGGHLEAPAGGLELPAHPASATGPDVREWVLGSEGRLGIVTDATLRVRRRPEREVFVAMAFPEEGRALEALRALLGCGAPLSMLRLLSPGETEVTLAVGRPTRALAAIESWLTLHGVRLRSSALLVAALTGSERQVRSGARAVRALVRSFGGRPVPGLGAAWSHNRFRGPYLRDALFDLGYGVDSVETAARWSALDALRDAVEGALGRALEPEGERVVAFSHVSHVYPTGANLYTTFLFRLGSDADGALARWRRLKDAASRTIVARAATISHQHGIGSEHRPWLEAEKGPLAVAALRRLAAAFDPDGVLNPGKLFEER